MSSLLTFYLPKDKPHSKSGALHLLPRDVKLNAPPVWDAWSFMSQSRKPFFQTKLSPLAEWLFVLPSLLLLALLALPVLALLWRAGADGMLSLIAQPTAVAALRLSLFTSTISVLIAIVTGTPLAFVLARRKFRSKTFLELLIDLPIVLPPSVAGIALLVAFGRQGVFGSWLNSIGLTLPFTTGAVVLAQTFVSAPLFVRAARIGFAEIEHQIVEAAYVEGSNEWQLFRYIMVPLAGRAVMSGAVLAWTRAIGEFGATILFAGNLEGVTQTMPLAIYLGLERSLGVALALSTLLVFVSFFLLLAARRLEDQKDNTAN
ncbi:MAG: ABC transporter permease [Anaerolineae bacterium]|nr:ABC transporter permease [Anaerolineae bacterium]